MDMFRGKAICEIGCSSNSFRPEGNSNMRFNDECSSDVKKGTIFSLIDPILLWCVGLRSLENHPMFRNKLFDSTRYIL